MRKQELVHLHELCVLVREEVTERGAVPDAAFERYDASRGTETSIHLRKAYHEDAVFQLLDGITATLAHQSDVPRRSIPASGRSDSVPSA